MTTDDQTQPDDLCCTHGQQLDKLAAELTRANQLLADLVEIRRGTNAQRRPTPEEVVAFARGGIVQGCQNSEPHLHGTGCVIQGGQWPDSGIQVHIDPHHVIGATIHELRRQGRLK